MRRLNLFIFLLFAATMTVMAQSKQFPTNVEVFDLQGQRVDLKELLHSGKPTLVSFWATWCKPCKLELTAIADVYPEWQEKYGLQLVAISTDNARTLPKVKSTVSQHRWDYIVLNHPGRGLQTALNFNTIPESFLLDGKGNILWRHSGYVSGDEYEVEEKLAELLPKK